MPRIPWDLLAGSPFVDEVGLETHGCWLTLTHYRLFQLKQEQQPENFTKPSIEEDRTVDFSASLSKVAKRMAFGAVVRNRLVPFPLCVIFAYKRQEV